MVSVYSNLMTNVAPLRRLLRRAFGAFSLAVATLAVGANAPGLAQAASQEPAQSVPAALTGVFKGYSPGTNEITVGFEGRDRALQLAIPPGDARQPLQQARAGDLIRIDVDDAVEPEAVKKIDEIQRPVSVPLRLISVAIALLVALGAASIATRGKPLSFAIGADNRYSNSQVQLAAWFAALAVVYLATVTLRIWVLGFDFVGGVGITENLATLTGLSALSFGGAKMITSMKLEKQAAKGGASQKRAAASPNLLTDLFTNDEGLTDLGDFQMIAITVVAVGIFVVTSFHWLHLLTISTTVTLPDIDTSLLTTFGVGQGAYLVKKAALNVGEG